MPLRVQLKIFSRAGLSFPDSSQNGIHNVSRTVDRKPEHGDGERLEAMVIRGEADSVFLSCQESARPRVAARLDQSLEVVQAVSMVIAKDHFRRGRDSRGPYLSKKLCGSRDAAEDNRPGRRVQEKELALDLPDRLLL